MQPGRQRGETDYVWPGTLVKPADLRLIYLDLNHWIALAKAMTGHPDGERHKDTFTALRAASTSGRFAFPLSASHYMEVARTTSARQRFDIAQAMEALSGFAGLVPRTVVSQLEIGAALDEIAGPGPGYLPVSVLCQGVLQMFGKRGGLRFRNEDGSDATERVRAQWRRGPEAFDRWQRDGELRLDREVLRGPADDEVAQLRVLGWDPGPVRQIFEERATSERELALRLSEEPRWRLGRVRDVVSARHIAIDLNPVLAGSLAAHGLQLEEVIGDPPSARRFVESMPSADVAVSLMTAAHRNAQTQWTTNDIFDIDALSVAVPYCHIVVTERHAAHVVRAEGVADRCETVVLATLDELMPAIS